MKKILLLINPQARNGENAEQEIREALIHSGHHIINPSPNERSTNPNDLIRKYRNEVDVVLIGGGDGSINLALPSLVETKLPLVVYPLGTANNLARSYSLPAEVSSIVNLLEKGKEIEIDVGEVNGIYFVNVAGLGLSTEINRNVSKKLKRVMGVGAFILKAIQMASQVNPFKAFITINHAMTVTTHSWQISVCNGKYYGAGMAIKDSASLEDGKLHCLSTEVDKWWKAVVLLPSLFSGKFKREHDVTLLTGKEIVIETRRRFLIDVDGDLKTQTPATFRVLPKQLKLLIPGD